MICLSPPRMPWPMVGDRTTIPRTRPLYSVIRYPSNENVVVVCTVPCILAPRGCRFLNRGSVNDRRLIGSRGRQYTLTVSLTAGLLPECWNTTSGCSALVTVQIARRVPSASSPCQAPGSLKRLLGRLTRPLPVGLGFDSAERPEHARGNRAVPAWHRAPHEAPQVPDREWRPRAGGLLAAWRARSQSE